MGLFSREKKENNSAAFPWQPLENIKQLDDILNTEKTILIFKHSTRCGISKMALKSFQSNHQNFQGVVFYLLDLLNHRDISTAISEKTGISHQSPQIILWKNGAVVTNANHQDISNIDLSKYI